MKSSLDIVLPCYNPAHAWQVKIVDAFLEIQKQLPEEQIQIILVNDGSAKGIEEAHIDFLTQRIPLFLYLDQKQNQGKGAALRAGVQRSQAEICLFTDVDFPYETKSFLSIFQALKRKKVDISIGIKDPSYYSHLPWLRIQVSKFLRFLARTFMRISITDTQCGLKGFNAKGREIFLQTSISRYLADLEFIFLADRQKDLVMKALPVSLKPGVIFSKVNPRILLGEGINFLRVLLRSFGSRS